MNQKSVGLEFRRPPHCCFSPDNLFNPTNQLRPFAPLASKRVDDDVILFSIYDKRVHRPVRADLGWRVNHYVVVGKAPFPLIITIGSAIYYSPALWRINGKANGVGLVIDHIHKDRAAVKAGVLFVQLREGPRKVVTEYFV